MDPGKLEAEGWKLEGVNPKKPKPEEELSTEIRLPAWVLTVTFGFCLACMLIHSLRKLPGWLLILVGIPLLFAGIGYGFWLGDEHERSPWLARKPPPWPEGDYWVIEIKIPNWTLTLLVGLLVSLFPIAFVKNLVPAPFFPLAAGLLLLAGNGFGIWLHSRRLGHEAKGNAEKDS